MSDGHTLLMTAAADNNLPLAKLLIAHGANVNAKNDHGETPFSYCCANDSIDVARLLFSHSADINTIDTGGGTPLDWAASRSSIGFQEWLISVGGKRHDVGESTPSGACTLDLPALVGK